MTSPKNSPGSERYGKSETVVKAYSIPICPGCGGRLIPQEGRLMKCPKCNLIEDRDFIAAINLRMWGVWGSPEWARGFEGLNPDERPMKANPYGVIGH